MFLLTLEVFKGHPVLFFILRVLDWWIIVLVLVVLCLSEQMLKSTWGSNSYHGASPDSSRLQANGRISVLQLQEMHAVGG